MDCPTCFYTVAPGEVIEGSCPVCDTPLMDQPGGSKSDFELYNMKDPGYGQDMGGNPLQEGILGDWQNRSVRDESFASVKSRSVTSSMPSAHSSLVKFAGHQFQVDMSGPRAMIHNGNLEGLGFYGAKINGTPVQGNEMDFFRQGIGSKNNPHPVNVEVEHPGHEQPVRAMLEHGGTMNGLGRMGDYIRPHVFQSLWDMQDGTVPWPSHIDGSQVPVPPRTASTGDWFIARTDVDLPWTHSSVQKEAVLPALALTGARAGLARFGPTLLRGAVQQGKTAIPKALSALKSAPGGLVKGIGKYGLIHGLANAVGGLGGGQGSMPPQPTPLRNYQQLSHTAHEELLKRSDLESPSSIPELGVQDGDPEKVDAHEVNYGDSANMYDETTDDGGAENPYHDDPYQSLQFDDSLLDEWDDDERTYLDLLPKLLQYAESDSSGLEDPEIRAFYERQVGQNPEFATTSAIALPQMGGQGMGNSAIAPLTTPNPPASPIMGAGACAVCGGTLNQDGTCPSGHDGGAGMRTNLNLTQPNTYGMPQVSANTTSTSAGLVRVSINDHQGPSTSEQFSAVAQLLMEQGREGEIPGMLQTPWEYAAELAQVANKLNKPPIDQSQPAGPPEPAIEEAPPGATMPMQGPTPGMPLASVTAALKRVGADSLAPRCPSCSSASTGVTSDEGNCHCHRCGNDWIPEGAEKVKVSTPRVMAPEHQDLHVEGPIPDAAVPEADQEHPEDPTKEESNRTWETIDGEPLRVGETYEMRSEQYTIPDVVRVEAIKPDAIDLTFLGEYSAREMGEELTYRHELNKTDVDLERITFQPYGERTPDEDPDAPNPLLDAAEPGQVSDLSTPHEKITSIVEELVRAGMGLKQATVTAQKIAAAPNDPAEIRRYREMQQQFQQTQPQLEDTGRQIMDENQQMYDEMKGRPAGESDSSLGDEAVFNAQPGQNWRAGQPGRGLIDAEGGVHTWDEDAGTHHDFMQGTGIQSSVFFSIQPDGTVVPYSFEGEAQFSPADEAALTAAGHLLPAVEEPAAAGASMFGSYDSHDQALDHEDPDLAWLKGGSAPVAEAPADSNDERAWLMDGVPRTAGAKFSPSEQRDFIDEDGVARNADKLELGGTHYEARWDAKGNADEVDDGHFSLGLL